MDIIEFKRSSKFENIEECEGVEVHEEDDEDNEKELMLQIEDDSKI